MTSISVPTAAPSRGLRRILVAAVLVGVVAALPWLGVNAYWLRQVELIAILALVISGLNLSLGFAGELALGQAAAYAAGAYAGGYVASYLVNDLVVAIVAGVAVALIIGLLTGGPGLRLGGWVLAIASLFLVLLIPDLVQLFPQDVLGGTLGLAGIPIPAVAGVELDQTGYYVAVVLVAAAWFVLFRNLVVSRYGSAFGVLKESTTLAASLGISPYRTKLLAYATGAMPAGAAGALLAYLDSYISPASFTLNVTIAVLAASVVGGSASVYGVFVGAVLLQLGPLQAASFERYSLLVYGAFLVLSGVLFSGGAAALALRVARRLREGQRDRASGAEVRRRATVDELPSLPGEPLVVEHLSKRFGGVTAVDDVSFTATPGAVTALIGPNGSGKTSLLNVVAGHYTADSGAVRLGGRTLTGLAAHTISRLGIARTFQTPSIPERLTVRDVVATGRFATDRASAAEVMLRLPRYRRAAEGDRTVATESMAAVGILDRAGEHAADLAVGTRRMLELARCLAARPAVLLLDEVASGMDVDELEELSAVIRALRAAGATVLLVEHNFSLVRSLADTCVVLADGRIIANGPPTVIERDPEVIRRYLGGEPADPAAVPSSTEEAR